MIKYEIIRILSTFTIRVQSEFGEQFFAQTKSEQETNCSMSGEPIGHGDLCWVPIDRRLNEDHKLSDVVVSNLKTKFKKRFSW